MTIFGDLFCLALPLWHEYDQKRREREDPPDVEEDVIVVYESVFVFEDGAWEICDDGSARPHIHTHTHSRARARRKDAPRRKTGSRPRVRLTKYPENQA